MWKLQSSQWRNETQSSWRKVGVDVSTPQGIMCIYSFWFKHRFASFWSSLPPSLPPVRRRDILPPKPPKSLILFYPNGTLKGALLPPAVLSTKRDALAANACSQLGGRLGVRKPGSDITIGTLFPWWMWDGVIVLLLLCLSYRLSLSVYLSRLPYLAVLSLILISILMPILPLASYLFWNWVLLLL